MDKFLQTHQRQEARGLGRSSIYVFAADVDALYDELSALGCVIETAPADYDYGMPEMSVRYPDGNRITFGQEVMQRHTKRPLVSGPPEA